MTSVTSCTHLKHNREHYSNTEGNSSLQQLPIEVLHYIGQLTATRNSESLDPVRYCVAFGGTCGLMHLISHELIQDAMHLFYEDEALMKMWELIKDQFTFKDGGCPQTLKEVKDWLENPDNKSQIDGITELDLSGLDLRAFPSKIHVFTKLKTLNLSQNQITRIPESIGSLVQLKRLHLYINKITSIPESIGKLVQLESLCLESNQITSIPESIGKLVQLKMLELGKNQITIIPDFIGNLVQLNLLDFTKNQITHIPEAIGKLVQLEELYLGKNQITSIPDFIGKLVQLEELYLGKNQITSIPDFIGNLVQLTMLDLTKNQITHIPEAIGKLVQLEQLYLSSNQITSIPEAIGKLVQLKSFSIDNNLITSIPEAIGKLVQLKSFLIDNNPFLFTYNTKFRSLFNSTTITPLIDETTAFKQHVCLSTFSKFIQSADQNKDPESLKAAFAELDPEDQHLIYEMVYQLTQVETLFNEGELDIFDDMRRFYHALKASIVTKFERLSLEDKHRVYGFYELEWGEKHAFEHILRLVDTMDRL